MAYTVKDYQTGKAVKDDFKAGVKIEVYQPGPFGPAIKDGKTTIEGPHYPKAHKWYIGVEVVNGVVVKMK